MAKKKRKKKKAEQPQEQPAPALHIHFNEEGIPFLSTEGDWSYMSILNVLNLQADMIRVQLMDLTVRKALGHQDQMQEVLDAVRPKDESS